LPACLPACSFGFVCTAVVLCSLDLAVASEVADGWWKRLDELAWQNEVRPLQPLRALVEVAVGWLVYVQA
jgi:hypothetical protein